jgi:hypothetical protein
VSQFDLETSTRKRRRPTRTVESLKKCNAYLYDVNFPLHAFNTISFPSNKRRSNFLRTFSLAYLPSGLLFILQSVIRVTCTEEDGHDTDPVRGGFIAKHV